MREVQNTPWKIWNEIQFWMTYPFVQIVFALNRIKWRQGWHFYGIPIIQKHRQSTMQFGKNLQLRSSIQSNPLGPNHPVILCTWRANAILDIGDNFGMTGGSIVTAEQITIGNHVIVGANCTITDTDFHPLTPEQRQSNPQEAKTAPVTIQDDVFIGMNCLILKGVTIGSGSVIGAGSIVTRDVPANMMAAGNPAKIIKKVTA